MDKLGYKEGVKDGLPIGMGYFPVSMAFGIMAVSSGLSPLVAVLISLSNLTSAGQFAGVGIIVSGGTYAEMILSMLMINSRYFLMSLALSQRLEKPLNGLKKMLIAFGITDEVFAVASLKKGTLTSRYCLGLISLPYIGWGLGTLVGAYSTNFLPASLQDALSLALYAMFIALIVPAAKASKSVCFAVSVAALMSCAFHYVPVINELSSGFSIIISTLVGAGIAAYLFPIKEEEEEEVPIECI